MSVPKFLAVGLFLLAAAPAWAGDLAVVSTGAPVVVLRGAEVIGTTPFTLANLPAGQVELGFRDAPLSATAFTQVVTVPQIGVVRVDVNLPARTAASTVGTAAPVAVAAAPITGAAPPAAPPVEVKPAVPAGDIYVTSTPPGATIFLDSAPVGQVTPFVVRAVPIGQHLVEARSNCSRGSATLNVVNQTISRADLALVDRPGGIVVSAGAPGSLVFLDGTEVGTAPVAMKAVACGQHGVAIRAPGYLESTQSVDVVGDETLSIAVAFGSTPAPPPPPGSAGHSVQMLLRKEEFGTLVLDVTPLETALDVDGIAVGAGPRSIDRIAAGAHKVTGKLDGYTPLSVDVTVEPETIARANLALVASAPAPTVVTHTKTGAGKALARIALDAGISAIGLGASGYSVSRFLAAGDAFEQYKTVSSDAAAEEIYATQVVPYRVQAYVSGGVGLAGILAATGLWVTTDF